MRKVFLLAVIISYGTGVAVGFYLVHKFPERANLIEKALDFKK